MTWLSGCSYYGTDTYLVRTDSANFACADVTLKFNPILLARDKTAHAFAGIPYFPAIGKSAPGWGRELRVDFTNLKTAQFRNLGRTQVCDPSDLWLRAEPGAGRIPVGKVWASPPIRSSDGILYRSCVYGFGDLDATKDYSLEFRDDFLDCHIPALPLARESTSGYHGVVLQ